MESFLEHAGGFIVFADATGREAAMAFSQRVSRLTRTGVEMHFLSLPNTPLAIETATGVNEFTKVWSLDHTNGDSDTNVDPYSDVDSDLQGYLREQPMGTRVYVCGSFTTVTRLQRVARAAGLSAQEAHFEIVGEQRDRVYCLGCSQFTAATFERYTSCTHCGKILEISSHYSHRLQAVLGYLVLPEQLRSRSHEPLHYQHEVTHPEDPDRLAREDYGS